jgi:hypothetical protein
MFNGYLSTSIRTLFCPKQVGAILAKMWASRGLAGKNAAITLNTVRKTLHYLVGAFVNIA